VAIRIYCRSISIRQIIHFWKTMRHFPAIHQFIPFPEHSNKRHKPYPMARQGRVGMVLCGHPHLLPQHFNLTTP
jgi:hypothetical protein